MYEIIIQCKLFLTQQAAYDPTHSYPPMSRAPFMPTIVVVSDRYNSLLLKTYGKIDPRVIPLVLLVKEWAKRRGIKNPSNSTLSSYSYSLLVIYFLQVES